MAIVSRWEDVFVVKGSDEFGSGADFVSAQINKEQNDILQSRDLYLRDKFREYYNRTEIDNLFSSYTTNLDWKESVETYTDILEKYPTNLNWLKPDVESYGDIFINYPNPVSGQTVNVKNVLDKYAFKFDANVGRWVEIDLTKAYTNDYEYVLKDPVNYYEELSEVYPEPEDNWVVEVINPNDNCTYQYYEFDPSIDITITGLSINAPSTYNNDLGSDTIEIRDLNINSSQNHIVYPEPKPARWYRIGQKYNPEDGWVVNTKDTNYTYRFDEPTGVWIPISANAIPLATDELDGLLSHEDFTFLRNIDSDILPTIYAAIHQLEEKMFPLGTIVPYTINSNTPPAGFVFAEGVLLNKEEYSDMWEFLYKEPTEDDPGHDYTVPEYMRSQYPGKFANVDERTFRTPDLRGLFLRGLDYEGNIESYSREFGSSQNDAVAEHDFEIPVTGVGSIDDALIEGNHRLVVAGTTENEYAETARIKIYSSSEAETRPKNVAIRFIVKVIPTAKLPVAIFKSNKPETVDSIDADTLDGHDSSVSALPGTIPVAGEDGKLDSSWFDPIIIDYSNLIEKPSVENFEDIETTYPEPENNWVVEVTNTGNRYKYDASLGSWVRINSMLEDNFVRRTEVSQAQYSMPTESNMIPKTNEAANLDQWISTVNEEDVDTWIRYLNSSDYDISVDSYDDHDRSSKYFLTRLKFVKFLIGLKEYIGAFKQYYTTDDITPTNERGYISRAEKLEYADKYTKAETDTRIANYLRSYVPLADITGVPTANMIPIAGADGKLDPGWIASSSLTNKIGEDDNTGYVEVNPSKDIFVTAGIVDNTLTGNVNIQGGGIYSLYNISPAKEIISGYDLVENKGGNVEIYAGDGGDDISSIGGSIILQSGTGSAYDGTIDLNNVKINKNNTIYTNELNIRLQQNDGVNNTNYLELTNSGISYVHDNLVDNNDDFEFTLNNDGSVTTNRVNPANGITLLNDRSLVPFDNLPKTVVVNNIGDFIQEQPINTNLGNVIVGNIAQNTSIDIADNTYNDEARELTFILTKRGLYNITWPVNVTWLSGITPNIEFGETAIIKLLRTGNSEWLGWKVGDAYSSPGESSKEIGLDYDEVPPDNFSGTIHKYVSSTILVEEDEP